MAEQNSDFELFFNAVISGNIENFNRYYTDEYLEKDKLGRKPIHYASRHGQLEITKLLISKNCNIDAPSSDNWRAIHYACREKHSEIAKLLIEHNCEVELCDGDNLRPIHHACRYGPYEVAKLLIDRKCDIEAMDKNNLRPIHYASQNKHLEIVQLLIENNCKLDEFTKKKWCPLHYACKEGCLEIVKILIREKANIEASTSDKMRPIHFACCHGYIDIFMELLENGADFEVCDEKNWRPIHFACDNGYLEIFQKLINKNCDIKSITSDNSQPIHLACCRGHERIAQILINMNCDIEASDKNKWRPIHFACCHGQYKIANFLINAGCNIEAETSNNERPIHIACKNKKLDIVHLLIESDCCIDTLNNLNQFPSDIAEENKNLSSKTIKRTLDEIMNMLNEKETLDKMVNTFNEKKLNPNMKNGQRLLYACISGDLKNVKSLLERKCDINFCDEHNRRPILEACKNGHIEIVEILMKNNCNIDVLDNDNQSPINIAEKLLVKFPKLFVILNNEKLFRELIGNMTTSMDIECNSQCDCKLCSTSLHSRNFHKGELVGVGGFGKVFRCKSSQTTREFAIKYIPKSIVDYRKIEEAINHDLIKLTHIRIVKIFGAIENPKKLSIFMDFIPGGSLLKKIELEVISVENAFHFALQILEGLMYLHENKIVHRDIKPANILLDDENNVKLADFDLSRILIRSDGKTTNAKTIFGTAYYMAPEVFYGESYTFSSDIWSLGVTIHTMITGKHPYPELTPEQAMCKIATEKVIEFPTSLEHELKVFLNTEMLNPLPQKRSKTSDLLNSRYFQ